MAVGLAVGSPSGESWTQIGEFATAFGLSALIGLEREIKQKAAGIRTYTVVGVGAALFVLVSKFGFSDVLSAGRVTVDPSRVAAQIVSGLGFIGGGIIFVKRDVVRGLTTAASIWLTAAVAAAAAAGLPLLAIAGTVAYFVAILALPVGSRLVARAIGTDRPALQITYIDGSGLLRQILEAITRCGFSVAELSNTVGVHSRGHRGDSETGDEEGEVRQLSGAGACLGSHTTGPSSAGRADLRDQYDDRRTDDERDRIPQRAVTVAVLLDGRGSLDTLIAVLNETSGVLRVDPRGEPPE